MKLIKKFLKTLLKKDKDCFVYFLGDEGAILVFIENGIVTRRLFASSPAPENVRSFVDIFRSNPEVPIYVLVDMIDQSYVRHTLPPVSQLGVGKLVQRRLERDFAADDIKGALILGREEKGRKDWNLLLISLAHGDLLQQWLKVAYEAPNFFGGIYLSPVESDILVQKLSFALHGKNGEESAFGGGASFVDKLKKISFGKIKNGGVAEKSAKGVEWQVFVSHNKVTGLRQVVLRNGVMVFTRMTQLVEEQNNEITAASMEQEIHTFPLCPLIAFHLEVQ